MLEGISLLEITFATGVKVPLWWSDTTTELMALTCLSKVLPLRSTYENVLLFVPLPKLPEAVSSKNPPDQTVHFARMMRRHISHIPASWCSCILEPNINGPGIELRSYEWSKVAVTSQKFQISSHRWSLIRVLTTGPIRRSDSKVDVQRV